MRLTRLLCVGVLTAAAGVGIAGRATVPTDVYRFATLAGSPGFGNNDGPTASARLAVGDGGIARAADGTLWFADGHTIRKVTPAGDVETVAGLAGAAGAVDGTGSAARFNNPRGLAVAGDGTLYVADYDNHLVRRVTPAGVVTTVAGVAGAAGTLDGTGAAARFHHPEGVALDTLGRLWVADRGSHIVRRIDSLGAVTTIAGMPHVFGDTDLAGSLARFSSPRFIARGPDGSVYVADATRITRVSSTGDVTRVATMLATGMTAGHGDLLYVSTPFARVDRVSPLGGVEQWASTQVGAAGAITSDGSGQAWIVSPGVLLHMAADGTITRVAGSQPTTTDPTRLLFPVDVVAMADGSAVVSDFTAAALRRFSATGVVSTMASIPGQPAGIALEAGGTLVVADRGAHVIRRVTQAGVVSVVAGTDAGFAAPNDVAVGADGTIYVADTGNHIIRRISVSGVVSTVAGLSGTSGSTDGTGAAARFVSPSHLAFAGDGHLYVADDTTIRRVTVDGTVTTIAELGGQAAGGLATAPDGSLWATVASSGGLPFCACLDGIRRITTAGVVTTIAGTRRTATLGTTPVDGDAAVAAFAGLRGVSFDATGRVVLTDVIRPRVIVGTPISTEPALITTQPQSQSASSGLIHLTVGVSSTMEPRYQWERSTDGGVTWSAIDGATSATHLITVAREAAGTYGYRVVVNNGAGAVTSATATITLTAAAPVFVVQPQDQQVFYALNLGLYAEADGVGVTYVWERSLDGVSWIAASTSSPSAQLTVHSDLSNWRYRVVATNSAGSTTSNVARFVFSTLTFQPTLIRIPTVRTAGGALVVRNTRHTIQIVQSGAIVPDWQLFIAEPWIAASVRQGTGAATVTLDFNVAGIPATSASFFNAMLSLMVTRPVREAPVQLAVSTLQLLFEITDDVSPIGAMDSPTDGAVNVSGALPVTGWALDDVGVDRVEIWRNCVGVDFARNVCGSPLRDGGRTHVFIGNAAFIPGARPDVASQYPQMPNATRAGWGYLLLTNALPHSPTGAAEGGQGTFALTAYAFSPQGQMTTLGVKTITLNNDAASTPFGTLDTPEQGATIPAATFPFNNAAAYPVFGWAMTQPGKCIDTTSTSAYRVYVNGVARTLTPGVNWFPGLSRSDLAAAYPGRCNSSNALAAYYLDVRTLPNGLHTIGWDVTDDGNNTSGIGSRFFNVLIGADTPQPDVVGLDLPPAVTRTLHARIGGDDAPWQVVTRGATGQLAVTVPMGGRVVLDLGGAVRDGSRPAGSTLMAGDGRFYWMPPVGFLGTFPLWFTGDDGRIDVVITWVR